MSFMSSFKKAACLVGNATVSLTATSILQNLAKNIPTKNCIHKAAINVGICIIASMVTAASSKYIEEQIDEIAKNISVDARLKDGLTIEIKSEK